MERGRARDDDERQMERKRENIGERERGGGRDGEVERWRGGTGGWRHPGFRGITSTTMM